MAKLKICTRVEYFTAVTSTTTYNNNNKNNQLK